MLDLIVALGLVEKALNEKDIPLVEYGEIYHIRLGYPAVIIIALFPSSSLVALHGDVFYADCFRL